MEGSDRLLRRKSLKERLGLTGISCCGATWGLRPANMSVRDDEEGSGDTEEMQVGLINSESTTPEIGSTAVCLGQTPSRSGMNLAAALAAERQLRAGQDTIIPIPSQSPRTRPRRARPESGVSSRTTTPGTPYRVSLMRLLEETEAAEEEERKGDTVCCVCMVRKKGAAFIPCGHTFCRVCSRELWLNRGSCPLCSRSIVEILDIY